MDILGVRFGKIAEDVKCKVPEGIQVELSAGQ